jgi:SAM-dependent methyltransferase
MQLTKIIDRRPSRELMDDPDLGLDATERALEDLDRVTGWSGGVLTVRRTLGPRLAAGPRRQSLLDLGTGSGLVPAALAVDAARDGVDLLTVGCDRKLSHLLYGRRRGHRQLRVVARAQELPFIDGAFDWSLSTLLLHHFDRAGNLLVLAEMRRVTRAGVVVVDLCRSVLAPRLFRLLARLIRMGPVARHDGLVSLEEAWSAAEMRQLAGDLPVIELRRRFPFRLSLVIGPEPSRAASRPS